MIIFPTGSKQGAQLRNPIFNLMRSRSAWVVIPIPWSWRTMKSHSMQHLCQPASNAKSCKYPDEGYLQLSFLGHDGDVSRQQISVPTVDILQAENDDTWQIRVTAPVKQEILASVAEFAPNETGGILIGDVNPIHKVVYVTKALPPPPDSRSTPYMFERGVKDVPETVRRIQSRTGGWIDYVGEWHSHPNGRGQMSQQDKIAARQLQAVLKPAKKLVHIMIATPTNLHSHVYAGDTTI